MNSLGVMYVMGQGTAADQNTGIAWLQKAAAAGNQDAQDNLDALNQ